MFLLSFLAALVCLSTITESKPGLLVDLLSPIKTAAAPEVSEEVVEETPTITRHHKKWRTDEDGKAETNDLNDTQRNETITTEPTPLSPTFLPLTILDLEYDADTEECNRTERRESEDVEDDEYPEEEDDEENEGLSGLFGPGLLRFGRGRSGRARSARMRDGKRREEEEEGGAKKSRHRGPLSSLLRKSLSFLNPGRDKSPFSFLLDAVEHPIRKLEDGSQVEEGDIAIGREDIISKAFREIGTWKKAVIPYIFHNCKAGGFEVSLNGLSGCFVFNGVSCFLFLLSPFLV